MRGQNFDSDDAVETGVAGAVNLSHAAGAERAGDFVRAEFIAGIQHATFIIGEIEDISGPLCGWNASVEWVRRRSEGPRFHQRAEESPKDIGLCLGRSFSPPEERLRSG